MEFCGAKRSVYAIHHDTGTVLAYAFGTHEDEVLLQLKEILSPFGITRFYTDDWGAYKRHLEKEKHEIGKRNTQKIERKHLTLRTRIKRLARKTICFSNNQTLYTRQLQIFEFWQ